VAAVATTYKVRLNHPKGWDTLVNIIRVNSVRRGTCGYQALDLEDLKLLLHKDSIHRFQLLHVKRNRHVKVTCLVRMELTETNGFAIITLKNNENRFNPTFVSQLTDLLDQVEKSSAKALLITGGKYDQGQLRFRIAGSFRTALILHGWVKTKKGWRYAFCGTVFLKDQDMLTSIWNLLARILVFPLPTVAVISGESFAPFC
jgi:hypothetical protein